MKKIVVLLMAVFLLITVCGCQKNVEPTAATENTEEATESSTVATTEETETVIEYSLPEGEGVESVEDFSDPVSTEKEVDATEAADVSTEKKAYATEATEVATEPTEQNASEEMEKPAEEGLKVETCNCEYYKYLQMSPAEQEAYMESFNTPMAFIEWSKTAMAEHEAHDTTLQASGGDLDIGDYIQ